MRDGLGGGDDFVALMAWLCDMTCHMKLNSHCSNTHSYAITSGSSSYWGMTTDAALGGFLRVLSYWRL